MTTPRDIEELEQLVAAEPHNVQLLHKLGEACQRAGDNVKAADAFTRVAVFFERERSFVKAIALLKQAQRLDPSRSDVEDKIAELKTRLERAGSASAPEVVENLSLLWADLPIERQVELGCKWVDYTLRVMLADHFEREGASGQATFLKTLPVIDSLAAMQFADERTAAIDLGDSNIDASTAFFSARLQLAGLSKRFFLSNCCFMAVMGSRLSFGDDRVVPMIRRDLTMSRQ